jgi:excisionase family DNA binding protein
LLHLDAPVILALTVAEAAASLRMSRTALYAAIRSGELASYQVGRSRRISLHAIEAYQARLERETTQQRDSTMGKAG